MRKNALIWCSELGPQALQDQLLKVLRSDREQWDVLSPADSDFLARSQGYDSYVLSGSEKSVVDEAETTFVRNVIALVRGLYDRASVPVVGICFGSQVLAAALGGRVARNPGGVFRLGVETLKWTAAADFSRWPECRGEATLVASHGECVERLPMGSVTLATSQTVPHEIFLIGERCLGVQAHPELDNEALQQHLMPVHRPLFSPAQWQAVEHESSLPLRQTAVINLVLRMLSAGRL